MHSIKLLFVFLVFLQPNYINAQQEIHTWADEMPLFAPDGCELLPTKSRRKKCGDLRWERFITANLDLDQSAFENDINNRFLVKIQIDTNGNYSNLAIKENNLDELGEKAINNLFDKIQEEKIKWSPAVKEGKKVAVELFKTIYYNSKDFTVDTLLNDTIYSKPDKSPILLDGICEQIEEDIFSDECSYSNLQNLILKERVYPSIALNNGVEGHVLLKFIINKNGEPVQPKIARDIGASCGKNAINALNRLIEGGLKWKPAMKNNKPVNAAYSISVPFKITKVKKDKKKAKRKRKKKK